MHGSNIIVGAFFEDEDQNGNNTLSDAGSVYFYEGTDAAALPVTLVQFNAFREGDRVRLHWQTSTEQNNYGFYIQRSKDGKDWPSLGFVSGQGDSYRTVDYHFTDDNPNTGVNYYRLKQEDYDGSPAYSFPACCADADACGVDVSEAESVIGISGCVELNRAGTEDAACPAVTVSVAGTDVMLPGCCQTATKKCGGEVDVAELGAGLGVNLEGPNFGCQSPTLLGEADGAGCGQ